MIDKHTPGPWKVRETLTGALSINKTAKIPIAVVGGAAWRLGEETAWANARLIAAAPDLLMTLRTLSLMAPSIDAQELWDICEEAIAKAGGRA